MTYWVIKDSATGEYLGPEVCGYAYLAGTDPIDAEAFSSSLIAIEALNRWMQEGKCAHVDGSHYILEEVYEAEAEQDTPQVTPQVEPIIALEMRVAVLEELFTQGAVTLSFPDASKLKEPPVSYTLLELKKSIDWYFSKEHDYDSREGDSNLWCLWDKAYLVGHKSARDSIINSIENMPSGG